MRRLPRRSTRLRCIKGEQPAWHVADTPPVSDLRCYCPHAKGPRVAAHRMADGADTSNDRPDHRVRVPPDDRHRALHPANGSSAFALRRLRAGQATLYEDGPHGAPGCFPRGLWNSGWLELHSIDWITKIDPPARATTSGRVAACVDKGGSPTPVDQDISPPSAWFVQRDSNDTLHYCTLIDERFTTLGQVSGLQIQKTSSNVIHVSLTLNPISRPERRVHRLDRHVVGRR